MPATKTDGAIRFDAEYRRQLRAAVQKYPEQYPWPVENVDKVADKMEAAFDRGSFNKDGYAIRWTCKALGIPYTYAGIKAYRA